jgi:isopenicillin-N epimerase
LRERSRYHLRTVLRRRQLLLGSLVTPALGLGAAPGPSGGERAPAARRAHGRAQLEERRAGDPRADAVDEDYWAQVARLFPLDRSLLNLNHGGIHPTCSAALDARERHDRAAQSAPPHALWRVQAPRREVVRAALARLAGVDAEELALVRNASEGLEILQLGFDLEPGDELLASDQDYPRMLQTFAQREEREGLRLVTFPLPTPAEDPEAIVAAYREHITARTRLILVSEMVFLNGQVCPVGAISALGRERGIPVIVDGAHGFAHLPRSLGDARIDFYATSLHKWLAAPHGTGLLFVRRERIGEVWPLMAPPAGMETDVRKFEEIGTHPLAPFLAVAEALDLHEAIGPERKYARLVHLREYWIRALEEHFPARVRRLTPRGPGMAGGLATVALEGVDAVALSGHLWRRHHILTTAIDHPDVRGLRVSPSVTTRPADLDRFVAAVADVLHNGLPA